MFKKIKQALKKTGEVLVETAIQILMAGKGGS
jgi:hypothetical protein